MNEPQIRLVTEDALLREAFGWASDAPDWFRDFDGDESLEHFLSTAKDFLFYGLFDDEFTALLRFMPYKQKTFIVDLFARRTTNRETLTQACADVRDFLYATGVASGYVGWIPEVNRGVRRLYADLGFAPSGVVCYRGGTRGGRAVKLLLMAHSKGLEV